MLTLLAASAILLLAAPLAAEPAPPLFDPDEDRAAPYSPYFNGSFYEVGARAMLSTQTGDAFQGWGADVGLRFALPIYLADTRIAYRYDALGRGRDELAQHSAGLTLGLHPLYLFLLGNSWWTSAIASLHLELGLGLQSAALRRGPSDISEFGLYWSIGAGLDVPLLSTDNGYAPWLTVNYRNHRGGHLDLGDTASLSLSLHSLIVGLAWRINGLPF